MRVLVVDDEPSLLSLISRYLTRLGHQVDAFRDGRDAWRRFEEQPETYDLVLADLSMPELSGQDLLDKILGINPKIRVLVVSGYPFDISRLPQGTRNQVGYLQKPFLGSMLIEAIKSLTP